LSTRGIKKNLQSSRGRLPKGLDSLRMPAEINDMFPKVLVLSVCIAVPFFLTSFAAEDMVAPDLSTVIAELEAIQNNQTTARQQWLSRAIVQIDEAGKNASSASRAYADAKRAVEFDGKSNAGSRFSEWRSSKSDVLGSRGFQTAAQLHLHYLGLTLRQIGEPDSDARVTETLRYVEELAKALTSMLADLNASEEAKDLMNKPLQDGVFAKASDLGQLLTNQKQWELSAGNIDGILEKNLRRILRQKQDPRLPETWDLQISVEQEIAASAQNDLKNATFMSTRRPQLLWRKANDLVAIGQPVRGLSLMLETLRSNPTHPDIDGWVEAAKTLAKSQQTAG